MLYYLGYFSAEEPSLFNEEVTNEFVQSVFDFQDAQQLEYSDGIVGPSSLAMLKQSVAEKKIARQCGLSGYSHRVFKNFVFKHPAGDESIEII